MHTIWPAFVVTGVLSVVIVHTAPYWYPLVVGEYDE